MINKKLMILAIFLVSLLAVSAVSAADNITSEETDDIASIENQEILKETNDGTFADLANEIASATDELNLTRNYICSDEDPSIIYIDKAITINGNGHAINGNNKSATLEIAGSGVVLNSIIFKNIQNTPIQWIGDNGTLNNCNFTNTTGFYGGAIYWNGENGTITNCKFINTTAERDGGAIHGDGENGTIKNCKFINTRANFGSAIDWIGEDTTITTCNFINNTARTGYGGAIRMGGNNITITTCNFINNTARERGGAIIVNGNYITITTCNFINNTVTIWDGGAICWYGENGTITNCNFTNTTAGGMGSAIYWECSNGTLTNCNFINIHINYGYGSAIYLIGDNCTITDCKFTNTTKNTTTNTRSRSAIHWNGENGTITNCNFINTSDHAIYLDIADNCIITNCNFTNTPATDDSGAIFGIGNKCTITHCNFINIHTDDFPSAIDFRGEYGTVTNCNFININSHSSVINLQANYTIIKNNTFINSTGSRTIYSKANYTIIKNNTFINSPKGAIYLNVDNCTIKNCIFINSTAKFGGAIVIFAKNPTEGRYRAKNAVITNCKFINSTTTKYNPNDFTTRGGAIYLSVDNCTIKNCTFINSTAAYAGGAIEFNGGGSIVKNTFINSTAVDGGAIYWNDGSGSIVGNTFINSSAIRHGSAAYLWTDGDILLNLNYDSFSDFEETAVYWYARKIDTDLSVSDINVTYNSNGKLVAVLKDWWNGNPIPNEDITFVIWKKLKSPMSLEDREKYPNTTKTLTTDSKGQVSYSTDGIVPGKYIATITYAGSENYCGKDPQVNLIVEKGDAKVNARYDEIGRNLIATLKDSNGRAIKGAKIGFAMPDGVEYAVTDANGQAKYSTSGLASGSYNIRVAFLGDDIYNPSNKVDVKFTLTKIATKLTAKYDAKSKNIVAVVKDANGKPASGLKVGFAINGVKYVTTDANGEAKYSTADLADNTYTVNVLAYGNEIYENSNKQTVTFTIGNKQQAKIFLRNALYFVLQTKMVQLTLWDANNNPIAGKTVYLKLDEYSWKYSGVTDENGNAYIKVGVGFGVHGATVSFEGDENYTSNSKTGAVRVIKETPSLMLPGAYTKFKATDKTKTIKVYLKDRYNKPLLKDTKVFVTINGKQYVGQIDSEGIASININLNKAGVYNVDLYYTGNTAYNAVRKTTKITIV